MLRFRLLLVLVLALAACNEPVGPDVLQVTVSVTPQRIVPGDTTEFVVRITNPTLGVVRVQLQCTQLFEIENPQGDFILGREALVCPANIVAPITLGPLASVERRMGWTGQTYRWINGTLLVEPVPAGVYRVFGKLRDNRSAPESLEVEAP